MGAYSFTTEARGNTPAEAFEAARAEALYMHGHGGYTGTIAEKGSFVVFDLPAGMDADMFEQVVCDYLYGDAHEQAPGRIPGIDLIAQVYNDKWGPAVCVKTGDGVYRFMGLASS